MQWENRDIREILRETWMNFIRGAWKNTGPPRKISGYSALACTYRPRFRSYIKGNPDYPSAAGGPGQGVASLPGHLQELLGHKRSHLLLSGLAVACDRLGDQSRQKLLAQADLAHRDCVEKVIDDVLMAVAHEGNGCGQGV
jgi:hypothetical protein